MPSQSESSITKHCAEGGWEDIKAAAICTLNRLCISAAVITSGWLYMYNGGEIHSLKMFIWMNLAPV